jgi:hypothetical protein
MAKLTDGTNQWEVPMTRDEAERIVARDLPINLLAMFATAPSVVAAAMTQHLAADIERMSPLMVQDILDGNLPLTADKHLPRFTEGGRASNFQPEN